ncbi:HAMP domain-containing sensor histidine kinase [Dyadobacter sp. CY356]|uniref:tetratricopeptide repeat-containing sensor histidine kinase n=1 Tax=Dyadobacter sp. CY356 TaxID=2906442 RepID=UPI001F2D8B9E|nr:HAMP domain-containing sensor histidine kinase [Dyadobacter sp. CY356]MCF0058382.1 HAMP domain-containing histidine kinase [Dyadobacter sp. CY356]
MFRRRGIIVMAILALCCLNACENSDLIKTDHTAYVDSIREQAKRIMDKGENKKALAFFDSAYQVISNPGIGDEVRKLSFKGQDYFPKTGDNYKGIVQLDSIFFLLSTEELRKKYIREYSTALFQKGDLLFKIKRYSDAYQFYYRGKLIAQTIMDPCAVSEYTYRLGMVSYKQSKYSEAVNNFRQCFEDAAFCIHDFRNLAFRQELLANIALSYSKYNMTDSSLFYSNKALVFLNEEGKKFPERKDYIKMAEAVIYGNQAGEYYKKGDTLAAENLLKKSIATNRNKGFDIADSQVSMVKLGELYIEKRRLEDSHEIAAQLKSSLDSNYNLYAEIGLNKLNWKYYDKTGETEKAYVSLQHYMFLKDSLDRENKNLVTADVDREFQSLEQQYNYSLLSKENDLKKNYLYVTLLFSLMAIAILLLLFQNWKSSKLNVSALTNLNKQITFQNKQLEQTLDDLRQSNKDKDRILKVVAHDLRNPLGAISSIASLLLEEVDFSQEHMEFARLMKTSSLHSMEMINDLLAANFNYRPEEMKKDVVDMRMLLRECIEQLKFKADEKDQKIKLEITADIVVLADKEKIWRVLSNLIVNAIKFSPSGSVIDVKLIERNQKMELSIKDQGIGIPDELKDKIFDAFTDAKRKGTSGEQPFGLGLSISKQIIEAHGGKIWFDSIVNKGTTFYLELPAAKEKSAFAMSPTLTD